MAKKYSIPLIAIGILLAGILMWAFARPSEPMYQGRPLSFWLQGYVVTMHSETTQQTADVVMDAVGTNAIPTLLHMMQAHDSRKKMRVYALLEKTHIFKFNLPTSWELHYSAAGGFGHLGPLASNAVPQLISLYNRDASIDDREAILTALGNIGHSARSATPIIAAIISDPNARLDLRMSAFSTCSRIDPDANIIGPVLVKALNDNHPDLRPIALQDLIMLGSNGKVVVPQLLELLHNPDNQVRNYARMALRGIDPETAEKNPEPENAH